MEAMTREFMTTLTDEDLRSLIREAVDKSIEKLPGGGHSEFMRVDQVAEMIGVTKSGIYSLVARKRIPYIKRGHYIIFKRSEIIKWIQSGSEVTAEDLR